MGVSGFPAVQGGVPWVSNSAVPPASGTATAAASYVSHGDMMFQIAARWGRTEVIDGLLETESGQTRESGLGTVAYYEDFNGGQRGRLHGRRVRRDVAADSDGDEGRLGATIGVKNADRARGSSWAALSGKYGPGARWVDSITTFLDAARTWSAAHRTDKTFATDVVNVHYYSFGPGAPAAALSPEDDHVESKLAAVVAYRDQHMPDEARLVDGIRLRHLQRLAPSRARPRVGPRPPVVQGQWLVRDFLAALAAGVARATVFELDDTCPPPASACNTQFATAGLIDKSGVKKTAWYYLATVRPSRRMLCGHVGGDEAERDGRAQFAKTSGTGGAFVVWMGTSSTSTTTVYPDASRR